MKKLLYTIASLAALTAIACTKEQGTPEVRPEIPDTPEEVIEVPATLSGSMGDPTTKVSNDNNGAYKWQASDHVTILTNNGANREFSADEAGLTTEFSGHIPNTDALVGGFALYPASSNLEADHHSISGTTITFNIPTTLTWGADASYMPMYAPIGVDPEDAQKFKASFKAVGGAMKLICYNIPAGATTLAFTAKVNIAGNFTLNTTAETPTLSDGGTGKEIDIDFSGNYSANKVFYIPLPPVTLTGGFTITIFDSEATKLYEKTTTAAPAIGRNHLVIAPALNCGAAAADDCVTNDAIKSAVSGSYPGTSSSNTCSITSSKGKTWKVNACKQNDRMQLRSGSGSHIQLPTYTDEIASIILEDVYNASEAAYSGTLTLSTAFSGGTTIASVTPSVSAGDDVTITIPNNKHCYTGYLLTSAGIRITSITVKFRGTDATVPTISAGADELTIPVGSLSATINSVALANNVDGLGISADIVSQTPEGWIDTAVIENGTLTVTAKAANTNAVDNTATIKLKASGAAAYPITVTQTSCLVQAPSSYTAVAGDETATISWTKDEHASSYLAYLHTSATATPASGGTDVTSALTLNNGTYSLTKNDLTNNTTYYLYVKVNAVASNYQASPAYTSVSFTPRKASTEADPYKASEAYDNISSYASGEGPDDDIYVEGYVYTAEAPASNSQTYTIIWGDATTKALQVFEGKQISNADITDANKVSVGDYVKVKGAAINYNGDTPRLTSGNVILTHYPKLAAPTFSLSPNNPDDVDENKFYEAQTVTLSATNLADIYYTLDDSEPTTSSTHYTSPFAVSSIKTTTIKAIAVKANYTTSAVGEKAITIAASTQLEMSTINATADEDYINFSWTAVDNATGYQVSTDGGETYGATQDAISYKWENLTPSTSYTLYVKAIGTTNKKYTDSAAGSKTQSTNAPTPGWKETALSNISAGDVFVIVGNNGSNYAMNHTTLNSKGAPTATSVSVTGNKLEEDPSDEVKWNLTSDSSGYIFYPNGVTNKWLNLTADNNGVRVNNTAANGKYWTLDGESGYLIGTDTADATRYLGIYDSTDWRSYTSVNANISGQTFKFYKYNDNRDAAGIKWTADGTDAAVVSTATGTMLTGDDTAPAAALYNPHSLSVSYSSSNTDVAEISSAGVVTLKSAGEGVTISASFAGDATYKPSTVSYTLTVTDSRTKPVISMTTTDVDLSDENYNTFTGRSATVDPTSTVALPIVLEYSKTDPSNIISTLNSSTGALTLNGTTGTAYITVAFGSGTTSEYKTADPVQYKITVASSSGPESRVAPGSPTITAISPTSFTATWTAPASGGSENGYSWKLSTSSNPSDAAITNGSGNVDTGVLTVTVNSGITLAKGTNYYFHVLTRGDGGASYNDSGWATSGSKKYMSYTITWKSTNNSAGVSSYTSTWSVTADNLTCDMENWNNNNNGWEYVKAGRKNNASVATIITNSAISEAIKTVTLTIDAVTADKINSLKLYVSDNGSSWTEVGSFTAAKGNKSVSINSPASNKYYKFEANCASGSGNGLITVSKLVFATY